MFSYGAVDANGATITSTSWTLNGAALASNNPANGVLFRPGGYTFAVTANDGSGRSAQAQKLVQVVGNPLAVSRFHACALRPDASVACWGEGTHGELGNGDVLAHSSPVTVAGLSKVVSLALGHEHSCAVRDDGSAACWGGNRSAQLGDGTTTPSATPVAVPGLGTVQQLAAGESHTCALQTDGQVFCWGLLPDGQMATRALAVAGLTAIRQITAGAGFSCALKSGGSIWCWGNNDTGQLGRGTVTPVEPAAAPVANLTGVVSVQAGYGHVCALRNDFTVTCWGAGTNGQLGIGPQAQDSPLPVQLPGITDAVALSTGLYNACITRRSGDVECWGRNVWGESSDTEFARPETPTPVPSFGKVAFVAAGEHFSCALRPDGSAWCKGDNDAGELGNGSTVASFTAVPVVGGAAWWRP